MTTGWRRGELVVNRVYYGGGQTELPKSATLDPDVPYRPMAEVVAEHRERDLRENNT